MLNKDKKLFEFALNRTFNEVERDRLMELLNEPEQKKASEFISRKAAIEYLVTNMNWYNEDGGVAEWEEKIEAITDLANGIPSADLQPLYMEHYRQGREDGRAEAEGRLMQAFNPD